MREYATRLIAATLGLAALVAPSSALGATQVGATFDPTISCSGNLTRLQSGSPGAGYAVPSQGVLTSWSHQAGAAPPQLKLKVARPAGGDSFTIVGESVLVTPVAVQLNTYPLQITVQPNDVIGLFNPASGVCERAAGGFGIHSLPGDPALNSTNLYSGGGTSQLDVSATLEPDADKDGFGDETQDKCIGKAGPNAGCPAAKCKKSKKKKGKKGASASKKKKGKCKKKKKRKK